MAIRKMLVISYFGVHIFNKYGACIIRTKYMGHHGIYENVNFEKEGLKNID